jgi:hypothetical protein
MDNTISQLSRIQMEKWIRDNLLAKDQMVVRNLAVSCGLNQSDALRYQIIWIIHWILDKLIEGCRKEGHIELQGQKVKIEGERLGLVHHGKDHLSMQMSKGLEIDNELLTGKFIPLLATFINSGQAIMPSSSEMNLNLLSRHLPPATGTFAPPPPPPGVVPVSEAPDFEKKPEPIPTLVPTTVEVIKRPKGRPTKAETEGKETIASLTLKVKALEEIVTNLKWNLDAVNSDLKVSRALDWK